MAKNHTKPTPVTPDDIRIAGILAEDGDITTQLAELANFLIGKSSKSQAEKRAGISRATINRILAGGNTSLIIAEEFLDAYGFTLCIRSRK